MKIRRFVAKDMRTALTQIKEELGVDAVIMSNKKIPEGVELMAAVDYSHSVPDATAQAPSESIPHSAPSQNTAPHVAVGAREVTSDVVNIQTVNAQTVNTSTPQEVKPADSLSALLNRQVQQSESAANATHTTSAQAPSSDSSSIEKQLKSFTDRLQNSPNEVQQPVSSLNI